MGRWTDAAQKMRPIYQGAMQEYGAEHPEQAAEVPGIYPGFTYDGSLIPYKTIRLWTDGKLYIAQYDTYDREDTDPAHDTNGWFKLDYKQGYRIIPETMTTATMFHKDERGWWRDVLYQSLIDNNSWNPSAYPAGWEVVDIT